MVAMSAKLERTPQPCPTVWLYEDEIRSVEGPDARGAAPKEPPRCNLA